MKLHPKWFYLSCGMGIEGAVFGALLHDAFILILSVCCAVLNWYFGERRLNEEKINV